MAVILQGNLQRCRLAQDLLTQWVFEKKADLMIISEQYSNPAGRDWFADNTGTAAIWVKNRRKFQIEECGKGDGFVWIQSEGATYFSCYLSPNEGIGVFRQKLEHLEEKIRSTDGEVVVAGDFNAKSSEWGMTRSDTRGTELAEMVARLDMTILNTGTTTTLRRSGQRGSIIDLTMATPNIAARITGWQVFEGFTASDHQFIGFQVGSLDPLGDARRGRDLAIGWNVARLDKEVLLRVLATGGRMLEEAETPFTSREEAEQLITCTMRLITKSCDGSMPRRSRQAHRKPAYWWTQDIAELRRSCLKLRRRALRARRNRRDTALHNDAYKAAKKQLGKAVKYSKARCWRELCSEVDNDTWGRGYQIVTKKLGKSAPVEPKNPEAMYEIVEGLFPEHPDRESKEYPMEGDVPAFSVAEMRAAAASIGNRKAPGPDGIPAEVIKLIAKEFPYLLLNMYNLCLRAGVFGSRWKLQRLVLLDKGKGPPISPSSYRPLCMLDTAGKVLEKMIRGRLRAAVAAAGDLADNQHGFREGRSTIGAIAEALEPTERAWQGNHRTRSACVLVTLDVRNAFNSVRWLDILRALEDRFAVPWYITRIISDYLDNRELVFETTQGQRRKRLTSGVAQGSALGPDLWNVVYDGILTLEMPEGAKLVGFADDIAAIITARNDEQAKMLVRQVSRRVSGWLTEHGLELAASKTEIVVLTRQRTFPEPFQAEVDGARIEAVKVIRYLGIKLDAKLSFWAHIQGQLTRQQR